jgi:hypothetical protein
MNITRKAFFEIMSAGSVLLLLKACGGGGGGSGGGFAPPITTMCGAGDSGILGNHGHLLTILRADLDSTVPKTYSIAGSGTHDHTVTFSVAQLQVLKAGGAVTVVSSVGDGHTHSVTASVAASCP